MSKPNPYQYLYKTLGGDPNYSFYDLKALGDKRIPRLPLSIRVLLESAIRNCDEFEVTTNDVENILNWETTSKDANTEIPFKPSRVILQDFTGVPAVVDLAAMRDAMARLGGDPCKINPLVPVDLVIDHSVQVDYAGSADAKEKNEEMEFNRNKERFQFLKWGAKSFNNMLIVPPGSGIVHQVNLEYLAKVVFEKELLDTNVLYPDSLVGTDSHTTMINGLGVVGWGVGGIEAEAVMLGQSISMVLPEVVGFKLVGNLPTSATATDLVLTCTCMLRTRGVVGKFVEFFGPGVAELTVADRATIANMAPEYGATMGFFPVDKKTMDYLRQSGRDKDKLVRIEEYLKAQGMFKDYTNSYEDPVFSGEIMILDISTVVPCVAGPKRPQDMVKLTNIKSEFNIGLVAPITFKSFGIPPDKIKDVSTFIYNGLQYSITHGSIVIAAITSCTNTSNPGVMLGAGLLARNAVAKGLSVRPYIKCSLSPGSGVVESYFNKSGLNVDLDKLGFYLAGFGCMTCIGNSGDLSESISSAIQEKDLVAVAVLSGNRNFEGRVHPLTRANYLASPPLVVAFALAGRVDIDFETEPIGNDKDGKPVYLAEIWPGIDEVRRVESECLVPSMFTEVYSKVSKGNARWNSLSATDSKQYNWNESSTYIHNPPFFQYTLAEPKVLQDINNAYCLLNLADSITTDHISPAGNIKKDSPAGRYLMSRNVNQSEFNSYGSRRGNDQVMARGTFANIRIMNKLIGKVGPQTVHIPSDKVMDTYDAAEAYMKSEQATIIIAGKEYGSGSSRDWAAKGPYLQGVRAVIAESFERIHRSNLVGMGLLPLQFKNGNTSESLGLTGKEQYSIGGVACMVVGQDVIVKTSTGKEFTVTCRIDTEVELGYFQHGGILHYVLRKLLKA